MPSVGFKQRVRSALTALETPELAGQAQYSLRMQLEALQRSADVQAAYSELLAGLPSAAAN